MKKTSLFGGGKRAAEKEKDFSEDYDEIEESRDFDHDTDTEEHEATDEEVARLKEKLGSFSLANEPDEVKLHEHTEKLQDPAPQSGETTTEQTAPVAESSAQSEEPERESVVKQPVEEQKTETRVEEPVVEADEVAESKHAFKPTTLGRPTITKTEEQKEVETVSDETKKPVQGELDLGKVEEKEVVDAPVEEKHDDAVDAGHHAFSDYQKYDAAAQDEEDYEEEPKTIIPAFFVDWFMNDIPDTILMPEGAAKEEILKRRKNFAIYQLSQIAVTNNDFSIQGDDEATIEEVKHQVLGFGGMLETHELYLIDNALDLIQAIIDFEEYDDGTNNWQVSNEPEYFVELMAASDNLENHQDYRAAVQRLKDGIQDGGFKIVRE